MRGDELASEIVVEAALQPSVYSGDDELGPDPLFAGSREACRGVDALPEHTERMGGCRSPAAAAIAREMLIAMTANVSHAAFAESFPDGRWAGGSAVCSAMTCSMIA